MKPHVTAACDTIGQSHVTRDRFDMFKRVHLGIPHHTGTAPPLPKPTENYLVMAFAREGLLVQYLLQCQHFVDLRLMTLTVECKENLISLSINLTICFYF